MARLIVNADDFGMTRGVNRAIVEAHTHGIVTSATMMANVPAFDEAVQLARTAPDLEIGCHLVLVDGMPLSPVSSVPSLVESGTHRFHRKLWKFAAAAVRGKISAREVESECVAQIVKLQQAGMAVSHVDCHKHAHMFPDVLEGVLRAALATGVKAVRNPFEPAFARAGGAVRSAETAVLHGLYANRFRQRVSDLGLVTTDGSIGVTATGSLDARLFESLLRQLPRHEVFEFVCHPGYNDADLSAAGTRLLQSRETELTLLCSPEARSYLQNRDVELINFRQLGLATESKPVAGHPMP